MEELESIAGFVFDIFKFWFLLLSMPLWIIPFLIYKYLNLRTTKQA